MDKSILEDKKTVLSTDYTPQYEQLYIHPEEGEDFRINDSLYDIYKDMKFIDKFIIDKSIDLNNLLVSITRRLDEVDLNIKAEQERLQDIKMLCNKYTDFDNIIPINSSTPLQGEYATANNSFYCKIDGANNVKLAVVEITGNGIEGNEYVYKDFAYVKDGFDTSNRIYITDDSITSYYEYERISASSTEPYLLNDFNTDNEDAKCTITLQSPTEINLITVQSDNDILSVIGIQYSYNGIDYYPLEIPNIKINDKLACYDNYDYVCGDNKIIVPSCNFVKITFQSSGTTDDIIAYDRVMFSHVVELTEEEKYEIDAADGIIGGHIGAPLDDIAPTYNNLEDATVVINSAKRHVIKINDIKAVHNKYKPGSYFKTNELIKDNKFYAAALFLNAYIPEDLDEESLEFIFTVNGIDYNVTPVNNKGSGTKILRYSQGKSLLEYTELLTEPIKSLYLTIKMNGSNISTPIVGNIKVLLGGDI